MTGPLRGELRPWQLLGEYPDIAFPSDETLRGGRRLNRGADPMTDRMARDPGAGYLMDQSWHKGWLAVAAVVIGAGEQR